MSLKFRFLLFTGLLVIASATAVWLAARQLAEGLVEEWGVRYAEKQVLYDKARMLQPVLREIALSRQFARSPVLVAWAHRPDDPELTRRALAEMENYRANFADRSYFVALLPSGRYYHNNAANAFAGRQYRYRLSPSQPADLWFFDVVRQNRDIHLNVNPDAHLGVSKVWVNVLIRDGQNVLGVAGTGLDLTGFIRSVVEQAEPGITSLFVDHRGAIQVHGDPRFIDYASITKGDGERKTLDLLFDRDEDRQAIRVAMKHLERGENKVHSRFVRIGERRYLAGVAYLPEIEWYEITLLDLDALLPLSSFTGILAVFGAALLLALLLFNLMVNRQILRPLGGLEEAMCRVEAGADLPQRPAASGHEDEIGRLMRHFFRLAHGVREARLNLEGKIRERTEALDRLAKVDALTELLNRRGMTERIQSEVSRGGRQHICFGLLWLDIDHFKEINDRFGHAQGDEALKAVAEQVRSLIRNYDSASRWGGDEFLVLVQGCEASVLAGLGERIRAAVAGNPQRDAAGQPVPVTVSVGGYLAAAGEDMESALHKADQALYAAKADGRDSFRLWREGMDAPGTGGAA